MVIRQEAGNSDAVVSWVAPDERMLAAWANDIDTTEAGAYGCALAGLELVRGLTAIRRAETESGADYYVGPPGTGIEDLEDCLRLEVSGTDEGGIAEIRRRTESKVRQVRNAGGSFPAIVGIVGFKERVIALSDVTEET